MPQRGADARFRAGGNTKKAESNKSAVVVGAAVSAVLGLGALGALLQPKPVTTVYNGTVVEVEETYY